MFELDVQACGPVQSFKRLITPANKPQGFGFAEFEDPDSAIRCLTLLQGIELRGWVREQKASGASHHYRADRFTPTSHTSSQIKADEKTKPFLAAYSAQKMKTDVSLNLSLLYHCRILTTCMETGGRGHGAASQSQGRRACRRDQSYFLRRS